MIKYLLFLTIALLVIWLTLRLRRQPTGRAASDKLIPHANSAYHAVSIRFAEDACAAAKRRAGERYLASEPPELPLQGCDAKSCKCSFAHYEDRRSNYDRRSPFNPSTGASGTGLHEIERRQSGGRRESDKAN